MSGIYWRPFNLSACASPIHELANAENKSLNLSSCSPQARFPSGAASRRRGSASAADEAREPAATPVPAPRRVGLPVHFAAPEPHLQEARACLHSWDCTLPVAVRFRALDVPAHGSPALDPRSPFPAHMQPLFEAYRAGAQAPLAALLAELTATHRRVVVLHARMAAFAVAEATRLPSA